MTMPTHFSSAHDQFLLQLAQQFNRKWKIIANKFREKYPDPRLFYERIAHRGRVLMGKRKPCSPNQVQVTTRKWTKAEEIWLIQNEADRSHRIAHENKEKHGKKQKKKSGR